MTVAENSPNPIYHHILKQILGSGINIEPKALTYLVDLDIDERQLERIIQKISFMKDFNSYLSYENLYQLFTEINSSKSPISATEPDPLNQSDSPVSNSSQESGEDPTAEMEIPFDSSEFGDLIGDAFSGMDLPPMDLPKKQSVLVPNPKVPVEENPVLYPTLGQDPSNENPTNSDLILHSEESSLPEELPIELPEPLPEELPDPVLAELPEDIVQSPSIPEDETTNPVVGGFQETLSDEDAELARIRAERRKDWEKLETSTGTSTFKPIAAEYDAQIEILKDPSGKLYTDGKLQEFISVQQDKFEKLSTILKKRPESTGLLPLNMINRLENSTEVQFIGMVIDKRQTGNRNYLIEFEDMTGQSMTLVRQKSAEVYKKIDYLLPDHVVLVDGYLSVNTQSNSRIILVNDIIFPDSPNSHQVKCPEEDLAICFISDLHFGSKEWLEKVWYRFVDYLNCRIGNEKQREQAGKVKYLSIAGDIVDGIGVYPNQDKRLFIKDIYKQYEACAEYLAELPDYINIVMSPGDHDAVRKAIPTPALTKDFAPDLYNQGYTMVGNPAMVSLHGIKTQLYHGTSLIDINMAIPGMSNEDPFGTMKELLRCRDLAPTYGKKTEFAPVEKNWMVMDTLPDILHTGHLHKNGYGKYHGILLINSGCFQAQTDFMQSLGIVPDFGKPTIVNIKDQLQTRVIDLVGDN